MCKQFPQRAISRVKGKYLGKRKHGKTIVLQYIWKCLWTRWKNASFYKEAFCEEQQLWDSSLVLKDFAWIKIVVTGVKNLGDFKPVLKQFSELERENGGSHLSVYGLAFLLEQ